MEIDDFALLRQQLGSAAADSLLQQSADLSRAAVRKNDGVYRFGSATFAIIAEIADGAAQQVIEKISDSWRDFCANSEYAGISFSTGYAVAGRQADDQGPGAQQFLLSCEIALAKARELPGQSTISADENWEAESVPTGELVRGVVTSDPLKDYRNNRLLWHTTALIAAETDRTVARLYFQCTATGGSGSEPRRDLHSTRRLVANPRRIASSRIRRFLQFAPPYSTNLPGTRAGRPAPRSKKNCRKKH